MAGFNKLPEPRKIFLRKIRNPVDQSVLDHGLVIWFPGIITMPSFSIVNNAMV